MALVFPFQVALYEVSTCGAGTTRSQTPFVIVRTSFSLTNYAWPKGCAYTVTVLPTAAGEIAPLTWIEFP
jgi:hypothetical protein